MIVSEFPYSQIPVAQSLCLLYLLRPLFGVLVDQALSGLAHKNLSAHTITHFVCSQLL